MEPAEPAQIAAQELLAALQAQSARCESERQDAIARCLSASEGWKESIRILQGAFAPEVAKHRVKDD